MIDAIKKVNVADAVYESMIGLIAGGNWAEGTKIPSENELKGRFKVSRNTVRQAIQKMSALGIIEARQGEGTFVKKIDTSFYLNMLIPTVFLGDSSCITILEFEKSIQVESVKLAGKRASPEEIDGLKQYIQLMGNESDPEQFFEYDIEYHKYLSKITHNEMFYKSMSIIKSMLKENLREVVLRYGTKESIAHHTDIYQKLKSGEIQEATDIMDEHMKVMLDRLINITDKEES
ncbi:FadR/GntR family transcriptional regulator [Lachnospiraceae bacterium 54-53]